MPELPDVETFRRRLRGGAFGKEITGVAIRAPRMLDGVSAAGIRRALLGRRLRASRRHGKQLFVHIAGNGWLTLHFGMSGALELFRGETAEPPHTRLRIDFDDRTALAYTSTRMLGRIGLARTPGTFIVEHDLGPDALDARLDAKSFAGLFSGPDQRGGTVKPVKAVLMDQSRIAGIGNIFSDEILFQARLHPLIPSNALTREQISALSRTRRRVLEKAIEHGAGSERFAEHPPRGYLLPERRAGGHCPRCGAELATLKLSGRTGYFCARCQTRSGGARRSRRTGH